MIVRFLRIDAQQPIRSGYIKASGQYLGTQGYLPGSVLRGALAEWMKLQHRQNEIPGLVRTLRFGNCFPCPPKVNDQLSYPFPMTAVECKLHGGFKETESDAHGIRDTLLLAVAYNELARQGVSLPVPLLLRCTARRGNELCGGRMERVGGFYSISANGYCRVQVTEVLQTKVALSRYRRAAQEQMLYRVVSLQPPLSFIGRVWTDDEAALTLLREALNQVGVGGFTTRGFGQVVCSTVSIGGKSIVNRLTTFNQKLCQVWQDLADLAGQFAAGPLPQLTGTYFSVDLLAPAILRDSDGIPTLKLTLTYLGQVLEPVWWATQPAFVGGFSTAWGLPKPTCTGAAMGSVYVFRVEQPVEMLARWLEELENQGVGIRTDEGLGEILICHPFHEEVTPV